MIKFHVGIMSALLLTANPANAEKTLARETSPLTYEIEGSIKQQHLLELISTFNNKATDRPLRLILRNSYGLEKDSADLLMKFANWIDQSQIELAVDGICVKACGLLFLSAHKKILLKSTNRPFSFVMLQALVNDDDELDDELNAYFKKLIQKNSEHRFPDFFFKKITQVEESVGGILIANSEERKNTNTIFSKGNPGNNKPEALDGYTLEKLGILNE